MNPSHVDSHAPRWRVILALLAALAQTSFPDLLASNAGRDWGIEQTTYTDPVTGVRVRELTSGTNTADNLYFHFPNFTADNRHVLFVGTRGSTRTHLFQAEASTGRITQLTDDPAINARSACPDPRNPNLLYLLRGPQLLALDRTRFTTRRIGEIPGPSVGGHVHPTVSHDGLWVATGNIRLLATGLRDTVRVHAHTSFDRLGRYVQFHTGRTRETIALIDLQDLPTQTWTP